MRWGLEESDLVRFMRKGRKGDGHGFPLLRGKYGSTGKCGPFVKKIIRACPFAAAGDSGDEMEGKSEVVREEFSVDGNCVITWEQAFDIIIESGGGYAVGEPPHYIY